MREYNLSQQFALIGLDGLDSIHHTTARTAVLRGLKVAKYLEEMIAEGKENDPFTFLSLLQSKMGKIRSESRKSLKKTEEETAMLLIAEGAMEEVPDLLGCDMDYVTAGVTVKQYRSLESDYLRIIENVRAEILEDGPITTECLIMLWLFRETGCMHDLFSSDEQQRVSVRLTDLSSKNALYRGILDLEFQKGSEKLIGNYLHLKKNLFQNPYLQGANVPFPFFERRSAIFIDLVIFKTTASERRTAVCDYVSERGHFAEEVFYGNEGLLKIDNNYYRLISLAKTYKLPVQGVNLVPFYR